MSSSVRVHESRENAHKTRTLRSCVSSSKKKASSSPIPSQHLRIMKQASACIKTLIIKTKGYPYVVVVVVVVVVVCTYEIYVLRVSSDEIIPRNTYELGYIYHNTLPSYYICRHISGISQET